MIIKLTGIIKYVYIIILFTIVNARVVSAFLLPVRKFQSNVIQNASQSPALHRIHKGPHGDEGGGRYSVRSELKMYAPGNNNNKQHYDHKMKMTIQRYLQILF